MRNLILTGLVFWLGLGFVQAQPVFTLPPEGYMVAQTKQVSQFFRRFNGEETLTGDRLYERDRQFRDVQLRVNYLNELFDRNNPSLSESLKRKFITSVTQGYPPYFLDFHGGRWFAEVQTQFFWQGREENLILFMEIQQEAVGSKWVISGAYFQPFADLFRTQPGEDALSPFLHPLSHELDFMNLEKAFQRRDQVMAYAASSFLPDHLSLVLYEIQKGNLSFRRVSEVKMHMFQMSGWYFELREFQRQGTNSGWLISNLTEITPDQEAIIRRFIFRQ
jgi:hypothetical protein